MSLISIENFKSVSFFSDYINWSKDLNIADNKLLNSTARTAALFLSTLILLESIFIFVFYDLPMLIKNAYDSLSKKNPNTFQLLKPLAIIGSGYLAYTAYKSVIEKIQNIKNKVLIAGIVSLASVGIISYSIGYLRVF